MRFSLSSPFIFYFYLGQTSTLLQHSNRKKKLFVGYVCALECKTSLHSPLKCGRRSLVAEKKKYGEVWLTGLTIMSCVTCFMKTFTMWRTKRPNSNALHLAYFCLFFVSKAMQKYTRKKDDKEGWHTHLWCGRHCTHAHHHHLRWQRRNWIQ